MAKILFGKKHVHFLEHIFLVDFYFWIYKYTLAKDEALFWCVKTKQICFHMRLQVITSTIKGQIWGWDERKHEEKERELSSSQKTWQKGVWTCCSFRFNTASRKYRHNIVTFNIKMWHINLNKPNLKKLKTTPRSWSLILVWGWYLRRVNI